MQISRELSLRIAESRDLGKVNAVIEAAIMTWSLSERVKRLSLPSYRYGETDLQHLHLIVAESGARGIVGVAAWEPADPADAPAGQRALLLHGIYVVPDRHKSGIGTRLLDAAERAARSGGFDGLLVKANPDAQGFFIAAGWQPLPVANPERDYPHRYWRSIAQ